ncbi:MAG: hypothetical protein ACRCYU_09455 [Nocardioides sp.]
MEVRDVNGRRATTRVGAAEYLDIPVNTVQVYSSPARRRAAGWPEPLPYRAGGKVWFALQDLDAYAAARPARVATPVATPVASEGSDELVGVREFARIRGVSRDTFKRYVEDSLAAWEQGRDGYLPQPDVVESAPARGSIYRWRRGRAHEWSFPVARRSGGGRPPGRRPGVDDLRELLAEYSVSPTVREAAAALSERLGMQVSSQTVRRLRRALRESGESV